MCGTKLNMRSGLTHLRIIKTCAPDCGGTSSGIQNKNTRLTLQNSHKPNKLERVQCPKYTSWMNNYLLHIYAETDHAGTHIFSVKMKKSMTPAASFISAFGVKNSPSAKVFRRISTPIVVTKTYSAI